MTKKKWKGKFFRSQFLFLLLSSHQIFIWKLELKTDEAVEMSTEHITMGGAGNIWEMKIEDFFYLLNGRIAQKRVENAFQFNFHHSTSRSMSMMLNCCSLFVVSLLILILYSSLPFFFSSHPISENIFNPFISQSSSLTPNFLFAIRVEREGKNAERMKKNTQLSSFFSSSSFKCKYNFSVFILSVSPFFSTFTHWFLLSS